MGVYVGVEDELSAAGRAIFLQRLLRVARRLAVGRALVEIPRVLLCAGNLPAARQYERNRLRDDLHDSLVPVLASISMRLDTARVTLPSDCSAGEVVLAELSCEVATAVNEVRRFIRDLAPPRCGRGNLESALRSQALLLERAGADLLRFETEFSDGLAGLPEPVEQAAYRIAREALANVARHAEARRCRLRVMITELALQVEVTDDGRGLPPAVRRGLGMRSMSRRARELGGLCVVSPVEPHGTRVLARIPLTVAP